MQGGISIRGPLIPPSNSNNYTNRFECHPNANNHGTLLLTLGSIGVGANAFVAALIMARRSLRRWSSGLLLHGTLVDGARAALLIPLALSVLKCHPVTRCSLVDTAFLLLATVTSLNLLTASLSDAPLLPPPVLVPTLLQSAGYVRQESRNHYASPLYPKGDSSYYTDYYQEDANLLAETTAMPDSPQCVLFGTFMVWFAALTINLGPTFLSGALAQAQAEATPRSTSCPLVRGPARHIVLNALWATVNLLCVGLAAAHLRKLKKDLARARLGVLAAAGAGLAGMAGIQAPGYTHTSVNNPGSSSSAILTQAGSSGGSSKAVGEDKSTTATPHEMDSFLRQAQRNGRSHIRTLGTLAGANLICWLPLYLSALIAPVGKDLVSEDSDSAPYLYELTLILAFAHSAAHPILVLLLNQPLRHGLKLCIAEWCCFLCNFCGMDFEFPSSENSPQHSRQDLNAGPSHVGPMAIDPVEIVVGTHRSSRSSQHSRIHTSESLVSLKRQASIKSQRGCEQEQMIPSPTNSVVPLPPPPPAPVTSASSSAFQAEGRFRKQVSMEEHSPPLLDNRW